jgi:sRNA-binding carbon storage regulator CsrA
MDEKNKRRVYIARQVRQRILIGDSIVIRVANIEGKRVFLEIVTPHDLEVSRPTKAEDLVDRDSDLKKL